MLAIQTTAPRTRKRAAPAHVVVCLCGQRYDRFRADIGMTAGEATSALISAAGRDLSNCDRVDGAKQIRIGNGIALLTAAKCARWEAEHGPGRCCADLDAADADEQIDRALDLAFNLGSEDAPF